MTHQMTRALPLDITMNKGTCLIKLFTDSVSRCIGHIQGNEAKTLKLCPSHFGAFSQLSFCLEYSLPSPPLGCFLVIFSFSL